MTFSISARCSQTGRFGLAISSSSPAVAARCAHGRAGVGVVASQNITDPRLGQRGLDLMAAGASAQEALDALVAGTPHIEHRQLALVDRLGGVAVRSGAHALGIHATATGEGVVAAGNLLAHDGTPAAMVAAFEAASGALADRLIAGMRAAVAAGGEAGPVHSAGMIIIRGLVPPGDALEGVTWPIADLRVDWSEADPIEDLARLWALYAPQADAYLTRALNPTAAPSFGVPGDR